MLGSLDFYCFTRNTVQQNILKSGFCSIQFTVTFVRTQKLCSLLDQEYCCMED